MELRSRSSSSRKGRNLKHKKLKGVAVGPEADSYDSDDSRLVEEEYLPPSECEDSSSTDDDGDLVDFDYESQVKGAGRDSSTRKRVSYRKKKEATGSDVANEDINGEIELDVSEEISVTKRGKRNRKEKRKSSQKNVLMWEVWREEHERWLDENMTTHSDFNNQNEVVNRTYQAPSDLVVPLIRYQQEWLAWGLEKEECETKGGILADEMGMGKTIQAIALVLAKRELLRSMGEPSITPPLPASSSDLSEIQCTLVICPVVAVTQWVNEIERFTAKGSTKVWVYHGANRAKTAHLFSDYDFVITTYSIVEAEYRKNVMPPKEKCQYCGNLLYPEKMVLHLRYFCGPGAVRTEKQSKQVRKGKKNRLKFAGTSEKPKDVKKKGQVEKKIVLAKEMLERKSILHSVKWQRIILDEAHFIKERRSSTARSILALESSYKWALSGTPLQNRIGELYSLVRFLRIVPYSYYFCKDCDCRKLDSRSTTVCPHCPHKVRHFCWWNKFVAKPIQLDTRHDEGERAMFLLKNKILKNIVLRRTKRGRAADLALPPSIISVRRDVMDAQEEDYYQSVYSDSHAQFNTYIEEGTVLNNYAHIFDLLTRLRQAVDHPYLVIYSKTSASRSGDYGSSNNEQLCGICQDPVEDPVVAACAHVFCKSCLFDFIENTVQVSCPSCSNPLTADLTRSCTVDWRSQTFVKGFKRTSILNRVRLANFQSSTKIEALREEIRFMIERDGSAKGIVFSQFTSFLDLINYSLEKSGISCVQLVGSMSIAARNDAIAKFTDDPNCKIFLMSLKAGGVALNLTVASYVFLMDPWWNPAVEKQAQDRIHRIGQYKPIRIVRFIIKNTIEERILRLQEKKELVFEGTVGGSSDALGRLTVADMRFLFTM